MSPIVDDTHCARCDKDDVVTVKATSPVFGYWQGRQLCACCINFRLELGMSMQKREQS